MCLKLDVDESGLMLVWYKECFQGRYLYINERP
jgi:hypothetical protein